MFALQIYLSSSYETHVQHEHITSAQQTDILEWITNDVSRYTYLHYEPNVLSWHVLDNGKQDISQFTIELKTLWDNL